MSPSSKYYQETLTRSFSYLYNKISLFFLVKLMLFLNKIITSIKQRERRRNVIVACSVGYISAEFFE